MVPAGFCCGCTGGEKRKKNTQKKAAADAIKVERACVGSPEPTVTTCSAEAEANERRGATDDEQNKVNGATAALCDRHRRRG